MCILKLLKRLLPKWLKDELKFLVRYIFIKIKLLRLKNPIFLMLTPEYGNLGDQAIAIAEQKLFEGLEICEVTDQDFTFLLLHPKRLKRLINKSDILITGGGFLGTLWFQEGEQPIRRIAALFPNNRIMILPQTAYFEDSAWGMEELQKSMQIYGNCANLTACAREKKSYEIMKKIYPHVILVPDMVLSLNPQDSACKRQGAVTLFRDDLEKTMPEGLRQEIIACLERSFDSVSVDSMLVDRMVKPCKRHQEVSDLLHTINSKEFAVTDRLHGMIFSAITGTPCAVFNSKSHKVKGVYDWVLKDCGYVRLIENVSELEAFIAEVKNREFIYDNHKLTTYYDTLLKLVK